MEMLSKSIKSNNLLVKFGRRYHIPQIYTRLMFVDTWPGPIKHNHCSTLTGKVIFLALFSEGNEPHSLCGTAAKTLLPYSNVSLSNQS